MVLVQPVGGGVLQFGLEGWQPAGGGLHSGVVQVAAARGAVLAMGVAVRVVAVADVGRAGLSVALVLVARGPEVDLEPEVEVDVGWWCEELVELVVGDVDAPALFDLSVLLVSFAVSEVPGGDDPLGSWLVSAFAVPVASPAQSTARTVRTAARRRIAASFTVTARSGCCRSWRNYSPRRPKYHSVGLQFAPGCFYMCSMGRFVWLQRRTDRRLARGGDLCVSGAARPSAGITELGCTAGSTGWKCCPVGARRRGAFHVG